jgi:hypothetical protein
VIPELGVSVVHGGERSFQQSKLRVETEKEEHDEEEDGPDPGPGETRERLGVDDKCESLSSLCHVLNVDVKLEGERAQHAEDDAGGDEGRDEVERGDDRGVDVDLVVKLVVGAKHHEAAPAVGERKGLINIFLRKCLFN